jgi:glycerol-3-phosphate dehydrogenase
VPRLYDGDQAYALQHADRRLVFVIPYLGDFTLIGTTDVPWSGEPGPAAIEPMETEYLCDVVNRAFQRSISPADVVWTFSGIRALLDDGSTRASAVTRDYALDLDAPTGAAPSLSIVGGKLTTYRILAEKALEKLAPHLGSMPAPWTGSAPLPGGDIGGGNAEALAPALGRLYPFLGEASCRRLARSYGTRAMRMLGGVKSRDAMANRLAEG